MSGASSVVSRWALPMIVIWGQLVLSAWVFAERLPEPMQKFSWDNVFVLLSAPAASLVFLVVGRLFSRGDKDTSQSGDLILVWGLVFMFALHAGVLAVALGLMESLNDAIPFGLAALLLGLAGVLLVLKHGSAMGIRTEATLQNPESWRRAHRVAAMLLAAAAMAACAAWFVEGSSRLFAAGGPALGAVLLSVVYATQLPKSPPEPPSDEET